MKNRQIICITCILWICFENLVVAQSMSGSLIDDLRISVRDEDLSTSKQTSNTTASLGASTTWANDNIMLARSNPDYRVTPGDVYTLAYSAGSTPVSYTIIVDNSYRIRVSNLGVVNGAGKTFTQIKSEVETVVSNNYPLSGVQLVLAQPAVFRVYVNGEVDTARERSVWALTRLSTLAGENLTGYASIRDISIKSSSGQTKIYDLFKAQRFGDISQDPYLRPGDVITFNRVKRVVTIRGAVERTAAYQLLDGENIKELINYYGNGFTPLADKTRMELVRYINTLDDTTEKIFLQESDYADNYPLEHFDSIYVPSTTMLEPVFFVEGAVGRGLSATSTELVTSNRFAVQFYKGETYASVVRRNSGWFTAISDTLNAYILRDDKIISINLNPMLYDASYRDTVLVQENDILIVPFRQYFVTVAGSVEKPGRYPYIPDRDWEYYIGLAGGFLTTRNAFQSVVITDIHGKKIKKTDAITPETVITANTNHGLFYFNQYAPVITTALGLLTTFFSMQAYLNSR